MQKNTPFLFRAILFYSRFFYSRFRNIESLLCEDVLNKVFASAAAFALFALGGCAGRPSGNLIPVSASAPGARSVDMLVATTRAEDLAPAGIMFSGERGRGLAFADIVVSIPPDAARKVESHSAKISTAHCRSNAGRFAAARFRLEFKRHVDDAWSRFAPEIS